MGSLSVQQLATLLNLLSKESSESLTLEILCQHFNTSFPKSEAFKVGSVITHLLQFPGIEFLTFDGRHNIRDNDTQHNNQNV